MSDDQTSPGSSRNDQIAAAVEDVASIPPGAREVVVTGTVVVKNEVSTRTLWKIVGVVVVVLVGFILFDRARDLVSMLIISMFFSLALVPLVERLHQKRGWKRGAAVGAIYAGGALFMIVMVVFLIPMMVTVAQSIGDNWSTWMDNLNNWAQDTFNVSLSDIGPASGAGEDAAGAAEDWGKQALGGFLGALSTGIGLIFSMMTIALFTFYFTVDYQRIQRLVLSWFAPTPSGAAGLDVGPGSGTDRRVLLFADDPDGHQWIGVLLHNGACWVTSALRDPVGDLRRVRIRVHPSGWNVYRRCHSGSSDACSRRGCSSAGRAGLRADLPADRELLVESQAERQDDDAQRRCCLWCGPCRRCNRRTDGCVHGPPGRCVDNIISEPLPDATRRHLSIDIRGRGRATRCRQ